MTDRTLLLGWLAAVVLVTLIHDPVVLACLLAGVLALQGRDAWAVCWRALIAVAVVNLAVSTGYVIAAVLDERPWQEFVLRLNLRVLLLAVLTIASTRRLRVERALAGWPSLRYLAVLVMSQLRALQGLSRDCRHGFNSRNPVAAPLPVSFAAAARQAVTLMDKAERHAEALNQGMRSRGFFDDRT